jgi:hypothetical protein
MSFDGNRNYLSQYKGVSLHTVTIIGVRNSMEVVHVEHIRHVSLFVYVNSTH